MRSRFVEFITVHCKGDNLTGFNYSQRYALGHYLTLAINYLRECVSAFIDETGAEVTFKIWFRLWNIVCLQKIFSEAVGYLPCLPPAYVAGKVANTGKQVSPLVSSRVEFRASNCIKVFAFHSN